MKYIVYSVNIGKYDDLKEPVCYDKSVDYLLFTDDLFCTSNVWEIKNIKLDGFNLDNKRISKYIKINSHLVLPEHDISVYLDHSITPRFDDVKQMLSEINFTDSEIMIFRHRMRNCIYQEAEIVKKLNLDTEEIVDTQMNKYKAEGFPNDLGLFESGFLIRKNTEKVREFNELWWNEVKNHSYRDQLSQMYCAWKTNLKIEPIKKGKNIASTSLLKYEPGHVNLQEIISKLYQSK